MIISNERISPAFSAAVELCGELKPGVLREKPLLLRACRAGTFGTRHEYSGGSVDDALFTYLSGNPEEAFFHQKKQLFFGKFLVCLTEQWEQFLWSLPVSAVVMERNMMCPLCAPSVKELLPLPAGYRLSKYDAAAFEKHPFSHGENYAGYPAFKAAGAGAVVWYGDEIAASASSFLSFENEVELDISTLPEHRRKGLADHCTFTMLRECSERGITVHWDAQNEASTRLAISHGFRLEQQYRVYMLLPE